MSKRLELFLMALLPIFMTGKSSTKIEVLYARVLRITIDDCLTFTNKEGKTHRVNMRTKIEYYAESEEEAPFLMVSINLDIECFSDKYQCYIAEKPTWINMYNEGFGWEEALGGTNNRSRGGGFIELIKQSC